MHKNHGQRARKPVVFLLIGIVTLEIRAPLLVFGFGCCCPADFCGKNYEKGPSAQNPLIEGPELWRADAGSWQIADRSAARCVAVGDFRVHLTLFVVEL